MQNDVWDYKVSLHYYHVSGTHIEENLKPVERFEVTLPMYSTKPDKGATVNDICKLPMTKKKI